MHLNQRYNTKDYKHTRMRFKHTKHLASVLPPWQLASIAVLYPLQRWGGRSESGAERVFACKCSCEAVSGAIEIGEIEVSWRASSITED